MKPLLFAAALLAALSTCAQACPRHRNTRAVPVFVEGVGTVWVSARTARGRR